MALHPLLLSAAVGLAALGGGYSPAADARGYVSVSIGTPAPYYRGHSGRGYHRPDQVWVPAHWVSTHRGRVWVPAQYVRVRPAHGQYRRHGRRHEYRYDQRYGHGYDHGPGYGSGVIHPRPLPGGFYYQRGGYPPHDRGW